MKIKKVNYIIISIELILYLLSTGLLVYFAENSKWLLFFIFLGFSFILYILLKVFEFKPVLRLLDTLEEKEFYFNKKLSKYGIIDFYNLSDREENLDKLNELRNHLESTNLIKYVSLTGFLLVNRDAKLLYDELINFLDKNHILQIIILDPFSKTRKLRNSIHSIDSSNSELNYILDLNKKYSNLKIKVSKNSIYGSAFITSKILYYDPYHLGKSDESIKNRFFSVKISKEKNELYYNIINSHFENLWDNSINFEDYIKKLK